MHYRSTILSLAALALVGGAVGTARGEKFEVDSAHSTVLFRALHMGVSLSWGRFDSISGIVDLDEQNPAKSLIDVTIAAESIDTGVAKRDEHLRGPDFFNVRQFPKINFKSQSVRAVGPGAYEVAGILTLHGVSKPLTVTLKKVGSGKSPFNDYRLGVETNFQIKRTDFDMKNLLEGVGDDVLLIVSLEAAHK